MVAQDFNFAFEVLRKAEEIPSAIALRGPDWAMSYEALHDLVLRYAHQLKLRGVDRTACVMLMANRMPEGLALGLALALLGARWVRASSVVPQETLGVSHVFGLAQPRVIPHHNFHLVTRSWAEAPANAAADIALPGYGSPDDIGSFAASSGTTGHIKYIGKPYRVMSARIRQSSREASSLFCLFSTLSGAGFHALTSALANGSTIIASASDFAQLTRLGGESRVLASPAQMESFLRGSSVPPQRLPLLIAKGSIVRRPLFEDWLRYFRAVEIDYGSQEVGLVGSTRIDHQDELAPDGRLAYELHPGISAEVVGPGRERLDADTEGIVRLRTPSMVFGYAGSPADTAEAFHDGWFYPGDLGSLTPEGRLCIGGRVKDQFNFGGIKINGAEIDAAAAGAEGVHAALSFARINERGVTELCVLAVLTEGAVPEAAARDIRRRCAALRGNQMMPAAVYFADELTLNENGKPARDAALQMSISAAQY